MGKKKGSKGKAQGRAGQKQKAQEKQMIHAPRWAPRRVIEHGLVDEAEDETYNRFKGFAQSNSGVASPRNPTFKFRHQAIAFVSAGTKTPADLEGETPLSEMVMNVSHDDEDRDLSEGEDGNVEQDSAAEDGSVGESAMITNIVDISEVPMADMTLERAKAGSPTPSSSSEEVVLFHGRNNGRNRAPAPPPKPVTSRSAGGPVTVTVTPPQVPHVTDTLLAALEQPVTLASSSSSTARGWAARPSKWNDQQQPTNEWTPAPDYPYWKKGKPRPNLNPSPAEELVWSNTPARQTKVKFVKSASTDGVAEESVASLQSGWRQVRQAKRLAKKVAVDDREVNTTTSIKMLMSPNRRGRRGRRNDNRVLHDVTVSDEDDDEAEEAAYNDYMANLASQVDGMDSSADEKPKDGTPEDMIMSEKITQPPGIGISSGLKINEVLDGRLRDESEIQDDDDSDSSDDGPIGQDLSDLSDDIALNYSDLESSGLEDQLEYTEQQQWEDEEDLRQRRQIAMTDEQIARLFAKQQDFGIDANELMIDDGAHDSPPEDVEGIGDLVEARAGLQNIANHSPGRLKNKHGMRQRRGNGGFSYPDASALADTVEQYGENGFDIMDFDRPSLRNTSKGRKGKLPPELEVMSDDELRAEMRDTWAKDRAKKRLRKVEREELRAQGLLGAAGRHGKADLSQKYLQGMTMKQVHNELKTFLQADEMQSRALPPMAKNDRKALHEIANALNLKSKSVGKGNNRFPVLYKTSSTLEYDDHTFSRVMDASSRGFLTNSARHSKGSKKGGMKKARPEAGGFNNAAVSLRNGEIVGAGAAELGKENLGHRLMEKMGWTKGMALGKDGEGLLMPVEQVMRAGKAGLG